MNLKELGFDSYFEANYNTLTDGEFEVGRIAVEHKNIYKVLTEYGEILAEISGKMNYKAQGGGDYPAVGDWVLLQIIDQEQKGIIHGILPRKSKFSRNEAGDRNKEQIVAANIDHIFIVNALNCDFNLRRIERYLTLVWDSGAKPVIVLNKADLCNKLGIEKKLSEVQSVAFGVPIHVISCMDGRGFSELEEYCKVGETIALLGSSGVGKSSIINKIYGKERQSTAEIREGDDKGRHTTTYRELILIPDGGLIIDTPGMREIQLWGVGSGIKNTFSDIKKLAQGCKFNDCTHSHEPGCAVKKAIEKGEITEDRLMSYYKLLREKKYVEMKEKYSADKISKIKWKMLKEGNWIG